MNSQLFLNNQLELTRCPHCGVNSPNITRSSVFETNNADGTERQVSATYICRKCGGVVSAVASNPGAIVEAYYPSASSIDMAIPERARAYLQQAHESVHAPSGAVMLAASAVDAMLKHKGLTNGSLYSRIDEATTTGIITSDMALWAHQVRLDANDQRHADTDASLPTESDAKLCVEFAGALGQLLFVLPARVQRGIAETAA